MKPQHFAFVLLIGLIWASNIIATREAVMVIPPLMAVALRFAILLIACISYVKIVPGRMRLLIATAVITGAVQFGLAAISFKVAHNLSALAIAGQLGVPLSLLFAVVIDGERISWPRTIGILLAFAGVALLVFDPRIVDERLALLYTVGASICWAAGTLLFKRLTGVPVLTIYAWQALASLPVMLLASWLLEPGSFAALPDVPLSAFGWVAYTAIASSLIANAGMSWLLQRYPVSTITPLTLPTPLFAVAMVMLIYGTPLTPMMMAGGVLALAGVTIITLRTARKSSEKKPG